MTQFTEKETVQPKSKFRTQGVQALFGLSMGVLISSFMLREEVSITILSVLFILLIAVISFVVSLMIHETGHAVGGKLGGMEVMNLSYGPFVYAKVKGKSRFFFKLPALGYIGRAMMRFTDAISEDEMRKKLLRLIYAGPVSNIVTGGIALVIAFFVWPSGALLTFALVSLFLGLTNLANVETPTGVQTDGRMISLLKGKEPGAEVIFVSYQLLQEDPTGTGNWKQQTILKVEEVMKRYPEWPLASSLLATAGPYYYQSSLERFLQLSEERAFKERTGKAAVLQDLIDTAAATGLYFAGQLHGTPDIEEKLRLISDKDEVSRYMRDAYLSIVHGETAQAIEALDQVDRAIGEWHPLYLDGAAQRKVAEVIRKRLINDQVI
ncbi:M50 family metallopeptidase [Jeotgalibacillus haloalkalitolerans]|uniref:M50 family metallopeptidase n=1 Tax=Jeotgalibacillus haloalkalitolerans TaxID=3104292 RepID=A0ABU5KHS2_9BACL|nr:M50 family metallopeptidase [Jeotgalibacillus sp. HH7-29]MDZ5710780.1 M50 family metallopeptidase [Jeotgalibacillus sp. HH7-29]